MKTTFASLLTLIILFSCNSGKNGSAPPPDVGNAKILAVSINRDSTRTLFWFLRSIVKGVRYDSAKNRDMIVVDTIWYPPITVPMVDSLGKAIFDEKTKEPKINPLPQYLENVTWPKDSVIWDVANKDFDSLMRKR